LRQFFFSAYQYFLYQQMQNSSDEQLAAIAEKALKEVTYHLRWSSEWVIRLGDGTEESKQRMLHAIDELWNYTGEMFQPVGYELQVSRDGLRVDYEAIKVQCNKKIKTVLEEATLSVPVNAWMHAGGKEGNHTEHLGFILGEMQFLQRSNPGAEW
jgi:ring-1,2-phenylacetyl-CoA epoxidase subunit PaaC